MSPSVAVVGGGFGGVGAAAMLHREGYEDITVFEKADRVGGVWQRNTYPGAACDVPSHLYEFSFAPNRWSRRFAPQAEIREYVEGVARHFGVFDRIRTGTEVRSAEWDEGRRRWRLETSAGPHEAEILVAACGQLSVPQTPPIPGLADFGGPAFHTADWDHGVELRGKRVAVIGTGCSAIQVVPAIQPEVAQVDVYQRSAGWTMPKSDFAYSERAQRLLSRPRLRRLDRAANFTFHELTALALTRPGPLLAILKRLGRLQINAAIKDPELRRRVTPTDEFGCKRIMLTDEWYSALAQPNVELIAERIETVTAGGVRDATGVERPADLIVLATGFASHDFVAPMEIVGAGGRRLAEEWAEVPRAYLGASVPGFPNMFLLYGPNTNGGSGSVVYTLEAGVGHLLAALRELDRAGADRIEVRPEAAAAFDRELREALAATVWHSGCTSWYVDANGNDPSQWPWLWSQYRRRTAQLDPGAYALDGRVPEPAGAGAG
ncbi:MAG TPA: NAD(P)/FAD-dependent oxidoreductase [Solirubrobacterales bacterium]|nr:NAD(P)/FAD-dependent oxidoreductase [Solirubrobacterales bacterium]